MRITLAAIGQIKAGPERSLYEHYVRRLPWDVTVREFEEKRPLPVAQRQEKEGAWLIEATRGADIRIALDERGKTLSSIDFSKRIGAWRDEGMAHLAFIIGGSDGLSHTARASAHFLLSLGSMTWPHFLVRGLLAEQLYRAHTILNRHPYHRE